MSKWSYRKKPDDIEAFCPGPDEGPSWADDPRIKYYCPRGRDRSQWFFHVMTPSGVSQGYAGKDYIVRDAAHNLTVLSSEHIAKHYARVSDERAQPEDAKRLSPTGASAVGKAETPDLSSPNPPTRSPDHG